jgi:4-hydroxy-tetrahydrodipicolinate synthase
MRPFDWGKTLAAVVTPMDSSGNVNYDQAAKLCRSIIQRGCDGVVVCGTTGEAATLGSQEKLQLFTEIKNRVGSRGKVIAGLGTNCTKTTLDLIRQAENLPIDSYMVITPYYNKPNSTGLTEHFRAIDSVSTKPIMIYNVPSRTGLDVDIKGYEQIFKVCPKITAVKEASTDMEKASQLTALFGNRAEFFSGNDSYLLPLLALGFKGVVSVAANLVPEDMAKITTLVSQGDWQGARAVHDRLFPLFKTLFVETNPVPVKAALELQGWHVGSPRLPLAGISEENMSKIRALLPLYKGEGL